MPYYERYADSIEVTELGLPERIAGMINQTGNQRDQYPEKWD